MGEDYEATELVPLIPYIMAGVDTQNSLGRMHCGKFREVSLHLKNVIRTFGSCPTANLICFISGILSLPHNLRLNQPIRARDYEYRVPKGGCSVWNCSFLFWRWSMAALKLFRYF